MKPRKMTTAEVTTLIDNFLNKTYQERGSYSYAAGYLSSVLKDAVNNMPAAKQEQTLSTIVSYLGKNAFDTFETIYVKE